MSRLSILRCKKVKKGKNERVEKRNYCWLLESLCQRYSIVDTFKLPHVMHTLCIYVTAAQTIVLRVERDRVRYRSKERKGERERERERDNFQWLREMLD